MIERKREIKKNNNVKASYLQQPNLEYQLKFLEFNTGLKI